ncbi:MAG TPA: radical SAM protein [Acidimicrobiales bacterium]
MANGRYWLQTLGCPKNQVDSEKLAGLLAADGYRPADEPGDADLVVVNTCAFVEAARQESVDTVLLLDEHRRDGSRLVVTGCMAERYGDELAAALPEVDLVAGFGAALVPGGVAGGPPLSQPEPASASASAPVPVSLGSARRHRPVGAPSSTATAFDLLELPRPPATAPWAYVKVAEGCDRSCGFCAIPSFRGKQRSRRPADVLDEVRALAAGAAGADGADGADGAKEIVLVAQDLASYARDRTHRAGGEGETAMSARGSRRRGEPTPIVALTRAVAELVPRTRLLYLYPSSLTDDLVDAILGTGVPYFDLSLQHVSRPLLARMRRWGDGDRFLRRIARIRAAEPTATFRSSFILGYPGETEEDHDALLAFLRDATLDWAGFFLFSAEDGTRAADLPDQVSPALALERLRECTELQDAVTARRRDLLIGQTREVLVDAAGIGRTVHEAPEIDGVVRVPETLPVGSLVDMVVTASLGTDLVAEPVRSDIGRIDAGWADVGQADVGRVDGAG